MCTTTHTSTTVTCTAQGGLAYILYVSGQPQGGLTSVRPARQAYMPRFIEPSGSFHSVWPGLVGQSAVPGTMGESGVMLPPAVSSNPNSTTIRLSVGKLIGLYCQGRLVSTILVVVNTLILPQSRDQK